MRHFARASAAATVTRTVTLSDVRDTSVGSIQPLTSVELAILCYRLQCRSSAVIYAFRIFAAPDRPRRISAKSMKGRGPCRER